MKGSKLKIILISLFLILCVGFGGIFYYASTKINSKELRKIAIAKLQEAFPNAEIHLGKVDLNLGTSIILAVEKLELSLPKRKSKLFAVSDVEVKIPIFAVLTNGGLIKINLDQPLFHYEEFEKDNNWTYSMAGKTSAKSESAKKAQSSDKIKSDSEKGGAMALPAFLANSKVNLKMTNMQISYALRSKQSGKIDVNNFKVNNLGLEGITAYELSSKLDLKQSEKERIALDVLLIGQMKISDILKGDGIGTTAILTLSNFDMKHLPYNIPSLKTSLDLKVTTDGNVDAKVETSFSDKNRVKFSVNLVKSRVNINELDIELFLKDLMAVGVVDVPGLSVSNSKIVLNGRVSISEKGNITPDLNFSVGPKIQYTVEGNQTETQIKGNFKNSSLQVNTTTDLLGGSVYSDLVATLNLDQKSFDIAKMKPFKLAINANGIKLSKKFIRANLYPPEEAVKVTKTTPDTNTNAKSKKEKATPPLLPKGVVDIAWKNLMLAEQSFSGKGQVNINSSEIAVRKLNFKFSEGTGLINSTTNLFANGNKNKFDISINKLNLAGLNSFMPEKIKDITGTFTGKVGGTASTINEKLAYDVNVDVKAVDGELKGIDIKEYTQGIVNTLSKIPQLKDKVGGKVPEVDSNYKIFALSGRFKHTHYNLNKFDFIGHQDKVNMRGSGNIYPVPVGKESVVTMDTMLGISSVKKAVNEQLGSDTIPMRFKGPNFSLSPDYAYTTQKAIGMYAKKNKKKVVDKAKTKLKDKLNDMIKGNGSNDKVKKLLKGFF